MLTRATIFPTFLAFLFIPILGMAAPSITSLSPTSGGAGTSVTITGSGFGSTQGTSTVKFNGTTATTITLWSSTSIKAAVPTGASTGNVVVTVGGVASNGKPFTVTAPSITSLSPVTGGAGTSVTITGTGFGISQSTSSVQFNGTAATTITSWSATSIKASVPTGATTGNVVVTVGGMASAGKPFTVTAPSITSLSPASGALGASVTVTGTGFGTTQGSSTVQFNGTSATTITSWSATSIKASVPTGATTGNVVVNAGGMASNGKSFTVKPSPSIASLSPTFGSVGISVTISGANFGTTQGASTIKFNGVTATPTSWGASQIIVPVPSGASTGNVVVNTSGVNTNGINFTVLTISSISVTPANLSLPLNSVQQYTATAIYSDSSTQNLGVNATWSSSGTTVATIDTTGVLSAVAQGPATIQASFGALNGSTGLTVKGASFIPVGDLNRARWRHTATLLPNGQVLVVGGGGQTDFFASAELFDPVTRTFAFTNGDMGTSRMGHSATLLQNGKVLIVGGDTLIAGNSVPLATAEIYDPQTGLFSPTGSLHSARALHTATLLNSGKVLIGGPGTAELYDPATGTFSDTGILLPGQNDTAATLLDDGTVLIAGGLDHLANVTAATDIYDPVDGTFASAGNLNIASAAHTGTLLNNGQVLIAGGESTDLGAPLSRTELYDPTSKTFVQTASLAVPRGSQTAALLNDGTVLVVGGGNSTSVIGTAELFDPSTQVFIGAGALANPRSAHTETLLQDGTVLVTGGSGLNGALLVSAELYAPPLPPPSSLQITPAITSITIGQTKQFKVFDDLGRQRFDVVWTVSNTAIAPITSGDMPTLTALAAGQVTLMANVQGVTAQLQITIAPSSLQVTPATVNLQVGDTRQFTVVDNLGHPSGDVTWTVSDTSIATITTDNQPILTAVAAGQVTVTATVEGVTSQAHVTISTGTLAPGAVLWSSPPVAGFVPLQIAQAVPSDSGLDLYSIQVSADGTQSIVQGLKSDGQQLWQASLPIVNGNSVPDGSGGLLVTEHNTCLPGQTYPMTIVDLDGTTGQPTVMAVAAGVQDGSGGVVYCYPDDVKAMEPQFAIRGDGSVVIAAMTNNGLPPLTVNGLEIPIGDSITTDSSGRQFVDFSPMGPPIVDSDGSIYVEYEMRQIAYPPRITSAILQLLQIAPDNSRTTITLSSVTTDTNLLPGRIIPDGQGGVLATWTIAPSNPPSPTHPYQASHVVAGVPGAPYDLPFTPQSVSAGQYPTLVLGQNNTAFATDGINVDPGDSSDGPRVVSFDLTTGVPNWSYQVSTQSILLILASMSDGGLAVNDSANGILQFDVNGTPLQLTTPIAGMAEYSWGGNWFLQGGQAVSEIMLPLDVDPAGIWATPSGNPSQTSSIGALCGCLLQTSDTSQEFALGPGSPSPSKTSNLSTPLVLPATVANCPICNLPPPTQIPQAPSCTTFPASGPTYLILIGDPGLFPHDAHQAFNLAAQTEANSQQSQGNNVVACRVSSVENVVTALTTEGFIGGGIIYFGHSGPFGPADRASWQVSILEVGEGAGDSTNVSFRNVSQLAAVQTAYTGGQNIIGPNAAILLNGCRAAVTIYDHYALFETSIAQLIANNTKRGVYAYKASTYFSLKDRTNATSSNWAGEPNPLPESVPIYLIPEGPPGRKPAPIPFIPQ